MLSGGKGDLAAVQECPVRLQGRLLEHLGWAPPRHSSRTAVEGGTVCIWACFAPYTKAPEASNQTWVPSAPQSEQPAHVPTPQEGRREAILGEAVGCSPLLPNQVRRASRGPLAELRVHSQEFLRHTDQCQTRALQRLMGGDWGQQDALKEESRAGPALASP